MLASVGPFPRDPADTRVVNDTRNGTGGWIDVCNPTPDPYNPSTGSPPVDSDGDGMPDEWESANGLNPNNGSDYNTSMNGGYMAIEVYVNELADQITPTAEITYYPRENYIDGAPRILANPNPFFPSVNFTLVNMERTPIRMAIYDMAGRLIYKSSFAGTAKTVSWNGRSQKGKTMGTGIYLARFTQGGKTLQKRVSLIK